MARPMITAVRTSARGNVPRGIGSDKKLETVPPRLCEVRARSTIACATKRMRRSTPSRTDTRTTLSTERACSTAYARRWMMRGVGRIQGCSGSTVAPWYDSLPTARVGVENRVLRDCVAGCGIVTQARDAIRCPAYGLDSASVKRSNERQLPLLPDKTVAALHHRSSGALTTDRVCGSGYPPNI